MGQRILGIFLILVGFVGFVAAILVESVFIATVGALSSGIVVGSGVIFITEAE